MKASFEQIEMKNLHLERKNRRNSNGIQIGTFILKQMHFKVTYG